MGLGRFVLIGVSLSGLVACAADPNAGTSGATRRFSQLGRAPKADTADQIAPAAEPSSQDTPWGRLASSAKTEAASTTPRDVERSEPSPDEAGRRVTALLAAQGFRSEEAAGEAYGDASNISATKMTVASRPPAEAACPLKALSRPQMYATTVNVRWASTPSGRRLAVDAKFEEVTKSLLSGEFSKAQCVSRGVLEAEVRRAAMGG